MVSGIIFSRDRACQLDLFLRSVTCHAPTLFNQISVIYTATKPRFDEAYQVCLEDHPGVLFFQESHFEWQTRLVIGASGDIISFFTDDSLIYRPLFGASDPVNLLMNMEEILCFSLRLGWNTGTCYPMRALQTLPDFYNHEDVLIWEWAKGDGDFGYMGSLDGHIFRRQEVQEMLADASFNNPNQLEDAFSRAAMKSNRPFAACHSYSHLVSVPVNRVNATHANRFGDFHKFSTSLLNRKYLDGERIDISSVNPDRVTAAHAETEYKFVSQDDL